jgi:hypothetical protein
MTGKMTSYLGVLILVLLLFTGIQTARDLRLEDYNGGFFSMKKPEGWDIFTAGHCTLFAFYIRDRQMSLNQVFYFGSVGPVYLSQQQKDIDRNYMRMGGYAIAWREMPIVSPLTPENFLRNWQNIVSTQVARQFLQPLPQLKNIHIISSQSVSMVKRARTDLIRAIFEKNGKVGEGLFLVTVVPFMPYSGGPGGGTAYGIMVTGITAQKEEFNHLQQSLIRSIQSFYLSQEYVSQCLRTQKQTYAGIMKAGQTLREASDIITNGWNNRAHTYDILSEKYSDSILGYERLYDPDTGTVYTFEKDFYNQYRLNPNSYNKPNLKPLPDNNYKLWSTPPLNGYNYIKKD